MIPGVYLRVKCGETRVGVVLSSDGASAIEYSVYLIIQGQNQDSPFFLFDLFAPNRLE